MTRRYFAPRLPQAGGIVLLDGPESHHAASVMRVRAGDKIELFDGEGWQADAVVLSADRRAVTCQSEPAVTMDRESECVLELGIAMPKGDRSKELVERLTELGVQRLVPIHCERTPWAVSENAITKWRREVIDACKQCGRNRLMQISEPETFASWCQRNEGESLRLIAHPVSAAITETTGLSDESSSSTSPAIVRIAIGPEGGFTEAEIQQADSLGWGRLSFGERIFRIETAAVVAAVHYCLDAPFSRTRYISRQGS